MATRDDMLKALTGPTDDYALPTSEKETSGGLYGWICPKCGAVMSPFQDYCVKCTKLSADFTWSTGTSVSLEGSIICHDAPTANYDGGKE
jgi:uncharacterized OB-fold protein